MNVLIIGSGGREHAIAWKIKQSPKLNKLYALPGNPGIAEIATCIDSNPADFLDVLEHCLAKRIDLVIVGPEVPLCAGLVDYLTKSGIKAFGPHMAAAKLEGSKAYAKEFMIRHNIPTAKYLVFNDAKEAKSALNEFGLPVVIKADGLAAGKGVIIAETLADAETAIDAMILEDKFGVAGREIVIEEFLTGIEASQICFVDHDTIIPLEGSQDYKRAYENDKGLNTGGMGNYSPSKQYDEIVTAQIEKDILKPFIEGLKKDGISYQGWIFIGLMIKDKKAKVIEFNVRFGDPEAQCIIPRLESDLLTVIEACLDNKLSETELVFKKEAAVTVILASQGYPEKYEKGNVIQGVSAVDEAIVFHAGTAIKEGELVTNGGRVLAVTALAENLELARKKVYQQAQKINFKGKMFRNDIAK